jgi:uncharacterized protein YbjT (DUF2867 family)
VRALVRSVPKLACRPWAKDPLLEIVPGDVLDLESLKRAAHGCRAAYYLVHSMISAESNFEDADRRGARNMVRAAMESGVERIIYLGGLGKEGGPSLCKHLRSRHEVARIFQSAPVPATILRAAMILGSGSTSFEMLRYLVDRLPVIPAPRWVRTPVQPIAIRDVLGYLQGCLEHEETAGQTYDIGGPDVLTYEDLIHVYAAEAHLERRRVIPVPFVTPKLSALWIHLITPVPSSIARPLGEGLSTEVVCGDDRIRSIIPREPLSCRETIRLALERIEQQRIETCWTDAGAVVPPEWATCGDAGYAGGSILECGYRIVLNATPEQVWEPIIRIGGENGWYFGNPLWSIRGWMDRVVGGVGLKRGRRHPSDLYTGDALDFWRVLEVDHLKRLVLVAEMKTPGEAVLEFKITPQTNGHTELRQLSRFMPRGLSGFAYWYSLYVFHELIFGGMLRRVAEKVGRPVIHGPERFTPRIGHLCPITSNGED